MILKCSYCSGTMRIDEEALHGGRPLKVRCPHCKGVGFAGARPSGGAPFPERRASSPGTQAAETAELALPPDAFKDFRFPSEEDRARPVKRSMSAKTRILVWIGASIGIIIIFALLVNLVLPGPPE
jgi:predicted Zn finger-like uncharacterized protein